MEQQRYENPEDLDEQKVRHVVNVLNMVVEDLWAVQRCGVGVQMDEIEKSERHDTGQLVKFSQQDCFAEFYRHSWSGPTTGSEKRKHAKAGLMNNIYILAFYFCSLKRVAGTVAMRSAKKIVSQVLNYR